MKKFKIKSFCKINLFLKILNKNIHNYHNINSLITFCEPYDLISIQAINNSYDKVSFSGKFKKGINKQFNTITKVLFILRKMKLLKNKNFKIDIKKNIPHGSGLGSGSSNAASLLSFLNNNLKLKLGKNLKNKISREIGFDVPVNLEIKNSAFAEKNNKILRFKQKFRLNILIVFPNIVCSTKKIYKKNKIFNSSPIRYNSHLNSKKKLINFLKKEGNDLEKAATKLYPRIKKVIKFIKKQRGCYFSRITGSGSACIGIFSDKESIVFTQKLIKSKFPKYWSVVSKTI